MKIPYKIGIKCTQFKYLAGGQIEKMNVDSFKILFIPKY